MTTAICETPGGGCGLGLDIPELDERLRTQTLARYFAPAHITSDAIKSASGLPVAPRLSSNTHLTALAQNGALRLNCDRSFISLLDTNTQYIIAEATRSISLRLSNKHSAQDALFLGVQALHKNYGVCPNTVSVFTDATGERAISTQNVEANTSRYIIRDFRDMDEYKNKPYVVGFPHMRSYAEVPLKTAAGRVIGSFCVVDSEVRDDWFGEEVVSVLTELSSSIMEYLDLNTVRHYHDRGERLMEGLSLFAEGRSSFLKDASQGEEECHPLSRYSGANLSGRSPNLTNPAPLPDRDYLSRVTDISTTDTSGSAPAQVMELDSSNGPLSPLDRCTPSTSPTEESRFDIAHGRAADFNDAAAAAERKMPQYETAGRSTTFSRAANLLREALEIDGLKFLDVPIQDSNLRGSISNDPSSVNWMNLMSKSMAGEDSGSPSRVCSVLGSSESSADHTSRASSLLLHESSLERLAKEYPHGHVFSADQHGVLAGPAQHDKQRSHKSPSQSLSDTYVPPEIRAFLSEQGSVIFMPLWDFSNEQFFAGLLGWTTDPTRIFEREDFTCLSAFGDSLMTECARIEAVNLARAKSDFISSISHELRSPLHGILASAEILRGAVKDESEDELVRMIESCGTTLLDTLNHLLDFSNINRFDSSKGHARKHIEGQGTSQDEQGPLPIQNLADLVEDVVEGVYLGFKSRMAATRGFENHDQDLAVGSSLLSGRKSDLSNDSKDLPVAVTVDIEQRTDWNLPLRIGAWKRIVMNLFANALKYTPRGYIAVILKEVTVEDSRGPGRRNVSLVVRDTGIGMSAEFVKSNIFTPFYQENPQIDGTGLGLSIVKQIVDNLGGKIEVHSELEAGTTIEVMVPLPTSPTTVGRHDIDFRSSTTDRLDGLKLCLVSLAGVPDIEAPTGVLSTEGRRSSTIGPLISKVASECFGMIVVSSQSFDTVHADLYVAEASFVANYAAEGATPKTDARRILCIDCDCLASASGKKTCGRNFPHVQYPIGPRSLKKAFLEALTAMTGQLASPPDLRNEGLVKPNVVIAPKPDEKSEPVSSPRDHLPIREGKVEPGEKRNSARPAKHLLLVDDNPINLKVLTTFAKKLGCTAQTAKNGLEAVELYRTSGRSFDVVFMDISMPIMDGFEAARYIREYEHESSAHRANPTRIIALTGLGSEASRQKATVSGIDQFRVKPVPLKELQSILDAL